MSATSSASRHAPWDLRAWRPSARRAWSLGILACALVVLVLAILLWMVSPTQYAAARWTLIAGVVVLLLLQAVIVVTGILGDRAPAPHVGHGPSAPEGAVHPIREHAAPLETSPVEEVTGWDDTPLEQELDAETATVDTEEAASAGGQELTLRCGGCGDLFTFLDPGTRPLRRACPHCGREGELQ